FKWQDLCFNSMPCKRGRKPDLLELCVRLGRECLQVGLKCGFQMDPIIGMTAQEMLESGDDALKKTLLTLFSHIGQTSINAMLQDLVKGRPTEVHHLNGLVAAKGHAAGIATPLNDEIVRIVEEIEAGRLSFGRENQERLEALVRAKG